MEGPTVGLDFFRFVVPSGVEGPTFDFAFMHYVYILSSITKTLYVGVTNNIAKRVYEHKQGFVPGFTEKYKVNRLVYLEEYKDIREAIAREKQLKNWRREKEEFLINAANPAWNDLSESF